MQLSFDVLSFTTALFISTMRGTRVHPFAWKDERAVAYAAADHVAQRSLASRVIPTVDAPDDIVFMRFILAVSQPSQFVESYVDSAILLTLVKFDTV